MTCLLGSLCDGGRSLSEAGAELRGRFAMTEQAERADVVEVALTSSLGDGKDVIGIPQAAAAGNGLHAVEPESGGAGGATRTFQGGVGCDGVDAADGAAAAVAGEDLVAEVAGIGSKAPLVNAVVAAEGAAAFGKDLKVAPAAKRQAIRSLGEKAAGGTAASERAGRKHGLLDFEDKEKPGTAGMTARVRRGFGTYLATRECEIRRGQL